MAFRTELLEGKRHLAQRHVSHTDACQRQTFSQESVTNRHGRAQPEFSTQEGYAARHGI